MAVFREPEWEATAGAPVFVGVARQHEAALRAMFRTNVHFFSTHLPGGPDELDTALAATPGCKRRMVWISSGCLYQMERVLKTMPQARFVHVAGAECTEWVRALGHRFPHAYLELEPAELATARGADRLFCFLGE
jgi:hypothetical protein